MIPARFQHLNFQSMNVPNFGTSEVWTFQNYKSKIWTFTISNFELANFELSQFEISKCLLSKFQNWTLNFNKFKVWTNFELSKLHLQKKNGFFSQDLFWNKIFFVIRCVVYMWKSNSVQAATDRATPLHGKKRKKKPSRSLSTLFSVFWPASLPSFKVRKWSQIDFDSYFEHKMVKNRLNIHFAAFSPQSSCGASVWRSSVRLIFRIQEERRREEERSCGASRPAASRSAHSARPALRKWGMECNWINWIEYTSTEYFSPIPEISRKFP